jgi:hypothetical protein
MTPVTLVEGTRNPDPVSGRNLAERRLLRPGVRRAEHEGPR